MQTIFDAPVKTKSDKLKLKKCLGCKLRPSLITGKFGLTNRTSYSISCVNVDCKRQPATGNCDDKHKAEDQWNTGMVTDNLFKKG